MCNLILFFSKIPKIFIFVRVREVAFLSEDWKNVLFKVSSLEMREIEACRKQMGSNVSILLNKVSVLEQDRFIQVSLYTVSWLFTNT